MLISLLIVRLRRTAIHAFNGTSSTHFPRIGALIRGSSVHCGKKARSPTVRSRPLKAYYVETHYRQRFSQCKLLGLHVQIEHELFNTVIGARRGGAVSRAPCCTRVYIYIRTQHFQQVSYKSRLRKYNHWVDLISWIRLASCPVYPAYQRSSRVPFSISLSRFDFLSPSLALPHGSLVNKRVLQFRGTQIYQLYIAQTPLVTFFPRLQTFFSNFNVL